MINPKYWKLLLVFQFLLSVFLQTQIAEAQPQNKGSDARQNNRGNDSKFRDSHHNEVIYHERNFPHNRNFRHSVSKMVVGGIIYYLCDGLFYHRHGYDYVVVVPPIGAVVPAIPDGFIPIVINGFTYYTSNGVYYRRTHDGYLVVEQPQTVVVETVKVVTQDSPVTTTITPTLTTTTTTPITSTVTTATPQDSFTVRIPSFQGGYVAVTLKRSKDGFIGPQGEFYPEFPSVEQLKVMYDKKK